MEKDKSQLEEEVIEIISQANKTGGCIDSKDSSKLSDEEIESLLATVSPREL